jgi:pilus assembly protein FimV
MRNKFQKCFALTPAAACIASAFVFSVALGVFAPHAQALSIGDPRTSVVLNAPLNVRFDVRLAEGERLESECVSATVSNGEQLISAGNMSVAVESRAGAASIRVSSPVRISEPIVSVRLTITCQGSVSRSFTLFANPAPLSASASGGLGSNSADPGSLPLVSNDTSLSSAVAPAPQGASQTQRRVAAAGTRLNRERGAASAEASAAPKNAVVRPATTSAGSTSASLSLGAGLPAATVAKAAEGRPTLKLDVAGGVKAFRLSRDLSFKPTEVTPERREELKKLRDALIAELNGAPGVSVGALSAATASRNVELEKANEVLAAQVKSLKTQIAAETALRTKAEAERAPSWMWPALIAGALALLALLAGLLLRRRSPQAGVSESVFAAERTVDSPSIMAEAGALPVPKPNYGDDDITPVHSRTWWGRMFPSGGKKRPAAAGFAAAEPAVSSAEAEQQARDSIKVNFNDGADDWGAQSLLTPVEQLAVNEVADLSQEADFFIEIGDYEQAIRLLEQNIDKEHEITPVPQLYLFDLYRRTGRKDEYTNLLTSFAQRFNVYIPAWDDQVSGRRELMEYSRAMEQICRAWRGSDALTMLEGLLVDDTRGQRMGFDLPAYRDIVFLYSIAKQNMVDLGQRGEATIPLHTADFVDSNDVDFELPGTNGKLTKMVGAELDSLREQVTFPADVPTTPEALQKAAEQAGQWPATVQINANTINTDLDHEFIDIGGFDVSDATPATTLPASDVPKGSTADLPTIVIGKPATPPVSTPAVGSNADKPVAPSGLTAVSSDDGNLLEFFTDEHFKKTPPKP